MASIDQTFYRGINATVFDVETTGLNFRTDRIIEACAIKVRNSEPVAVLNFMIQFEGELNPKVTEITGHTTRDVRKAPIDHNEAVDMLDTFFQDDTIIAYNGLFDLSFLESMYRRYEGDLDYSFRFNDDDQLTFDLIDPLTIARDRYPFPHKLGDMCKRLSIPLEEAHSAYHDTFALLDLVVKLDQLEPITQYHNFIRYKEKYGEPDWCPKHIRLESDKAVRSHSTSTGITKQTKEKAKTINKLMPKVVTKVKKKKLPTTEEVANQAGEKVYSMLPIAPELKNALDALVAGEVSTGWSLRYPSVVVMGHEYETAWKYLTEELDIPEEFLESESDVPDGSEVAIIYTFEG